MSVYECPYLDCTFRADTQEDVDDHVTYLASIGDPEHEERNRR